MQIYLLDINKKIIKAWKTDFASEDNVEVIYSDFDSFMNNYEVDCVVSPGNAHGVMVGGYDRALSEYFG